MLQLAEIIAELMVVILQSIAKCCQKVTPFFAVVFSRGSLEMLRLLEGHEYGGQVGCCLKNIL